MDVDAKVRVEEELGVPDPKALYLSFDGPAGVLAENLAPLMVALEDIYRRILILRLDSEVLSNMLKRQSNNERLNGVGRSINTRYSKAVLRPTDQINYSRDAFKKMGERKYIDSKFSSLPSPGAERRRSDLDTAFVPARIQISRCRMSSPGIIEILGDPTTLQVLVGLLATFVVLRGQNIQKSVALRGQVPPKVDSLIKLGYREEEVKAVRQYLDEDLDILISELENARARTAPGDEIDPTVDD